MYLIVLACFWGVEAIKRGDDQRVRLRQLKTGLTGNWNWFFILRGFSGYQPLQESLLDSGLKWYQYRFCKGLVKLY